EAARREQGLRAGRRREHEQGEQRGGKHTHHRISASVATVTIRRSRGGDALPSALNVPKPNMPLSCAAYRTKCCGGGSAASSSCPAASVAMNRVSGTSIAPGLPPGRKIGGSIASPANTEAGLPSGDRASGTLGTDSTVRASMRSESSGTSPLGVPSGWWTSAASLIFTCFNRSTHSLPAGSPWHGKASVSSRWTCEYDRQDGTPPTRSAEPASGSGSKTNEPPIELSDTVTTVSGLADGRASSRKTTDG